MLVLILGGRPTGVTVSMPAHGNTALQYLQYGLVPGTVPGKGPTVTSDCMEQYLVRRPRTLVGPYR